mmetsp:Transcript_79127/g.219933  ORF Transcript_79127/g.219933 Transcript_79127/m.219933 type:complete len:97 (+) Transcript_79127:992-1282(+)
MQRGAHSRFVLTRLFASTEEIQMYFSVVQYRVSLLRLATVQFISAQHAYGTTASDFAAPSVAQICAILELLAPCKRLHGRLLPRAFFRPVKLRPST